MKIFAVGMNYIRHNKELDGALYKTEEPVIFTKADSALLKGGKPFFLPDGLGRIDYETELVVRICRLGKGIPEKFAHRYYDAVTLGIDFTARDLQRRLRAAGQPWELCKGFDGAAAIGTWLPLGDTTPQEDDATRARPESAPTFTDGKCFCPKSDLQQLHFSLDINGHTVQQGFAGDMLYKVDALISYISRFFTLRTGDLLYTGTPEGVGPVSIDDRLTGYIEGTKVLEFNVK